MVSTTDVLRIYPGARVDRSPETRRASDTRHLTPIRVHHRLHPPVANCAALVGCPYNQAQIDTELIAQNGNLRTECGSCKGIIFYARDHITGANNYRYQIAPLRYRLPRDRDQGEVTPPPVVAESVREPDITAVPRCAQQGGLFRRG